MHDFWLMAQRIPRLLVELSAGFLCQTFTNMVTEWLERWWYFFWSRNALKVLWLDTYFAKSLKIYHGQVAAVQTNGARSMSQTKRPPRSPSNKNIRLFGGMAQTSRPQTLWLSDWTGLRAGTGKKDFKHKLHTQTTTFWSLKHNCHDFLKETQISM